MHVVRRWPFEGLSAARVRARRRRLSSIIRAAVNRASAYLFFFCFSVLVLASPSSSFLATSAYADVTQVHEPQCIFYTIYSPYPPPSAADSISLHAASPRSNGRSGRGLTFIPSSQPYKHWTSHPHCALLIFLCAPWCHTQKPIILRVHRCVRRVFCLFVL